MQLWLECEPCWAHWDGQTICRVVKFQSTKSDCVRRLSPSLWIQTGVASLRSLPVKSACSCDEAAMVNSDVILQFQVDCVSGSRLKQTKRSIEALFQVITYRQGSQESERVCCNVCLALLRSRIDRMMLQYQW